MEVWKPITDYEGIYEVSNWGNVRNANGDHISTHKNSKGYLRVDLYKNGTRTHKRVNRLVAEAFVSNPFNLPQVNHIDGNKLNNSYTNLEWVTDEENKAHRNRMLQISR